MWLNWQWKWWRLWQGISWRAVDWLVVKGDRWEKVCLIFDGGENFVNWWKEKKGSKTRRRFKRQLTQWNFNNCHISRHCFTLFSHYFQHKQVKVVCGPKFCCHCRGRDEEDVKIRAKVWWEKCIFLKGDCGTNWFTELIYFGFTVLVTVWFDIIAPAEPVNSDLQLFLTGWLNNNYMVRIQALFNPNCFRIELSNPLSHPARGLYKRNHNPFSQPNSQPLSFSSLPLEVPKCFHSNSWTLTSRSQGWNYNGDGCQWTV